jgi:putative endonuclease
MSDVNIQVMNGQTTLFDLMGTDGQTIIGTYQTGVFGEEVVGEYLRRRGWRVLGQRVRTRWGELDIIARRGDTIAFFEVKTLGPRKRGMRTEINGKARHRLRRAAVAWMATAQSHQRGVRRYRFDVCFVHRVATGEVDRIEHIPNAF